MNRLPCADPRRLRFLLAELPVGFVARLQAAIGQAGPGRFVRGDVRRRVDGYYVQLRFDAAPPAAGADLAELLAPLLALPMHAEPPAELLTPPDEATGTVIR